MRTPCTRVLMLAALFAFFTAVTASAQTLPTATEQKVPTKAEFLATLAGDPSAAPGGEALPPAPSLRSTVCSSNADCPPDQLCCYPCGIPDCNWVCMTPWRKGMCPPIV